MLKLITSNKVIKDIPKCITSNGSYCEMHPEISVGMNKIWKYLTKKAQDKEEHVIFSFNPVVFRIGLLLKLQGEKVRFFYQKEEVLVDDEGFFINPPYHFLDLEDKVQDEIREIRRSKKYE